MPIDLTMQNKEIILFLILMGTKKMLIDTNELKKILTLELNKANIKANVELLIKNSARALEGKQKTLKRYAPILKRTKQGSRYFYEMEDVQEFVGQYIDYCNGKFKNAPTPLPTIQKIHGLTLDDVLGSFDDGVQSIELADSMKLFTGEMYGTPTNVIVLNGACYYLTDGLNTDEGK